jgi:NADPH:quinone reductase-like Zn-dependent oxidoreductase
MTTTPTMRAIVLREPGPAANLKIENLPIPDPPPNWVRIAVRAFGLNRSDVHLRQGLAGDVTLPRVPGIEAVGVIDDSNGTDLVDGQQVAALMGGMGRAFDGGYAEYTVVPRQAVVPFQSNLPWSILGQVPETLQTAYGSITTGLDLQAGQTLLIRGGTSSLGFAVAALAHDLGATVLATTRQRNRLDLLAEHGVDHPILDNGRVADQVRRLYPDGIDAGLELVGTTTLPDTLAATKVHGTVCFVGMLSNEWIVKDFYPIEYLPKGVRLTAYGGEADDLPASILQRFLDRIAEGSISLGPATTYPLEDIPKAHADIDANRVAGKLVGITNVAVRHGSR